MKKLLMILLCFLFSAGCAAVQNERRVDGNVFYSSHLPKLTMSVDNSFKYIGEQKGKKRSMARSMSRVLPVLQIFQLIHL